jgi:hypothetical protein
MTKQSWNVLRRSVCLLSAAAIFIAGSTLLSARSAAESRDPEATNGAPTVNDEKKPAADRVGAEQNLLALDTSMMNIYEDALSKYKQKMRAQSPMILALFSETGGRMILYRPGQQPLESDPVPIVYQVAKSVSHSSMAIYQLVVPYLSNPADTSWREPMSQYRQRCQSALESLDALDLPSDDRETLRAILRLNVAFQDACLAKSTLSAADLQSFARGLKDEIPKTIWMSADAQVGHWFKVLDDWKKLVGADWDRTYAVTNTLYVTRQNNILFTILAQFMGQEAIGDRLMLFETTQFTTTPDQMLDLLARIVSDRDLGKVFFKDYYLMDAELLGSGARRAIIAETTRRGMKPLLPSRAPFRSTDWPWRTDPKRGTGPASLEDVK